MQGKTEKAQLVLHYPYPQALKETQPFSIKAKNGSKRLGKRIRRSKNNEEDIILSEESGQEGDSFHMNADDAYAKILRMNDADYEESD